MKKNRFFAFTLCIALLLPIHTVEAKTYENKTDLNLSAKSAILMEKETGDILYEQNSHEVLPPASITKIMTMLLIYEAQEAGQFDWTDPVTVSEHAASMGGSQIYLEAGETQTASDLTKSIAIASANDAAVAMAELISGSEEAFVQKMNEKAAELGMEDTYFVNACGLDADGHVSSAHDVALMSRELILNYPEIREYTTTWMDTITHHTAKGDSEFGLTNTNKLVKNYEGATGLKTGSTGKALYCLSGTAERNGMELIAVIMAAPDFQTRFSEDMKLLDYGFANFAKESGYEAGYVLEDIAVEKGMELTAPVAVQERISVLTDKSAGTPLESEIHLQEVILAPAPAGTKVGEIIYLQNGEEVGKTDLVTAEDVEKANFSTMLLRLLMLW